MRDLKFNISAQQIERVGDFSGLVAGTSGYLQAVFTFSSEWAGCNKVASFWAKGLEYPVPVINDRCVIPPEVLSSLYFKVQVTGKKAQYKIVTSKVIVKQEGV